MEERDAVAVGSGAWDTVDQGYAGGVEAGEFRLEVVGPVRDVVQAGSATLQEAPDGVVRTERLDQLHGADEGDSNALAFEDFDGGTRSARDEFERAATLLDGLDRDGHVIEEPSVRRKGIHGRMLETAGTSDKEMKGWRRVR